MGQFVSTVHAAQAEGKKDPSGRRRSGSGSGQQQQPNVNPGSGQQQQPNVNPGSGQQQQPNVNPGDGQRRDTKEDDAAKDSQGSTSNTDTVAVNKREKGKQRPDMGDVIDEDVDDVPRQPVGQGAVKKVFRKPRVPASVDSKERRRTMSAEYDTHGPRESRIRTLLPLSLPADEAASMQEEKLAQSLPAMMQDVRLDPWHMEPITDCQNEASDITQPCSGDSLRKRPAKRRGVLGNALEKLRELSDSLSTSSKPGLDLKFDSIHFSQDKKDLPNLKTDRKIISKVDKEFELKTIEERQSDQAKEAERFLNDMELACQASLVQSWAPESQKDASTILDTEEETARSTSTEQEQQFLKDMEVACKTSLRESWLHSSDGDSHDSSVAALLTTCDDDELPALELISPSRGEYDVAGAQRRFMESSRAAREDQPGADQTKGNIKQEIAVTETTLACSGRHQLKISPQFPPKDGQVKKTDGDRSTSSITPEEEQFLKDLELARQLSLAENWAPDGPKDSFEPSGA